MNINFVLHCVIHWNEKIESPELFCASVKIVKTEGVLLIDVQIPINDLKNQKFCGNNAVLKQL